jgi:hypothetical protein
MKSPKSDPSWFAPEHFPAKWKPVCRKKMLYSSARILIAKPVSTFAEYALRHQDLPAFTG